MASCGEDLAVRSKRYRMRTRQAQELSARFHVPYENFPVAPRAPRPRKAVLPSGLNAKEQTDVVCPVSVRSKSPDSGFHNMTVASRDADASRVPSGLKRTSWPQPS